MLISHLKKYFLPIYKYPINQMSGLFAQTFNVRSTDIGHKRVKLAKPFFLILPISIGQKVTSRGPKAQTYDILPLLMPNNN